MLCMNIVLIMTTPLFGAQLKPIQMAHIANGKIVMKIAVKTLIKDKIIIVLSCKYCYNCKSYLGSIEHPTNIKWTYDIMLPFEKNIATEITIIDDNLLPTGYYELTFDFFSVSTKYAISYL